MNHTIKHIIGYLIGVSVFIVLLPLGFYKLTELDILYYGKKIIHIDWLRITLSVSIFIIGIVFIIWSNISLFNTGKGGPLQAFGTSISPPTQKLVTTGAYAYSRNPMMFGVMAMYASIVLFLNAINGLIGLFILVCLAYLFIKLSEEKRLIKDFGDAYMEYKKRVSIIFPHWVKRK